MTERSGTLLQCVGHDADEISSRRRRRRRLAHSCSSASLFNIPPADTRCRSVAEPSEGGSLRATRALSKYSLPLAILALLARKRAPFSSHVPVNDVAEQCRRLDVVLVHCRSVPLRERPSAARRASSSASSKAAPKYGAVAASVFAGCRNGARPGAAH